MSLSPYKVFWGDLVSLHLQWRAGFEEGGHGGVLLSM